MVEECDIVLFIFFYKDLCCSCFVDFGKDFVLFGEIFLQIKLGISFGYVYGVGNSLELFCWKGDKVEFGYVCLVIVELVVVLVVDDKDLKGLNCLGEFILCNGFDGMLLDSQFEVNELGGILSGFKGEVYFWLDGYCLVMDNFKVLCEDKVYVLFCVINCFVLVGYNICGQQDILQVECK